MLYFSTICYVDPLCVYAFAYAYTIKYVLHIKLLRLTWTRCKHGHQYLSHFCRCRCSLLSLTPHPSTYSDFLVLCPQLFGHCMIDGFLYDADFCSLKDFEKAFSLISWTYFIRSGYLLHIFLSFGLYHPWCHPDSVSNQ